MVESEGGHCSYSAISLDLCKFISQRVRRSVTHLGSAIDANQQMFPFQVQPDQIFTKKLTQHGFLQLLYLQILCGLDLICVTRQGVSWP